MKFLLLRNITTPDESGNLAEIVRLEEEIAETKATIEKIKNNP